VTIEHERRNESPAACAAFYGVTPHNSRNTWEESQHSRHLWADL